MQILECPFSDSSNLQNLLSPSDVANIKEIIEVDKVQFGHILIWRALFSIYVLNSRQKSPFLPNSSQGFDTTKLKLGHLLSWSMKIAHYDDQSYRSTGLGTNWN